VGIQSMIWTGVSFLPTWMFPGHWTIVGNLTPCDRFEPPSTVQVHITNFV
jgi:hypothetical protein